MRARYFLILAIGISALGHLMSLTIFDVVINRPIKQPGKYGDIVFLGSILQRSDFGKALPVLSLRHETFYKPPVVAKRESALELTPPSRMTFKRTSDTKVRNTDMLARDSVIVLRKKETKPFNSRKSVNISGQGQVMNQLVEGQLRSRGILYKPPMPEFLKVHGTLEENLSAKFKILVSASGTIVSVEPVTSSGYPKFDLDCGNHLRQWRFAPAEPGTPDESGIVTLNLEAQYKK